MIDLVHLTLQLDAETVIDFTLQLVFLFLVFFDLAAQFCLIIDPISQLFLDLIVSSELRFEHSLALLFLFDFLIDLGKLIPAAFYLGSLIAWIHDHVLV